MRRLGLRSRRVTGSCRNVHEALRQLDVVSHVERSRSKGFHLWVFFTEAMPAHAVREGLFAACDVVGGTDQRSKPQAS